MAVDKDTLVIGKVTVSEREHIHQSMKPLVDYVASKLADFGIAKGDVFFARNNQEMIDALRKGKVDWVTDSTFSALILSEKTEAKIVLKRWHSRGSDYHGVIIVKKDSSVKGINDLRGKTIAFEDVGSTSSYFLPFMEFLNNGITPVHNKHESI